MKIAILGTGLIGKKIFTYLNDEEVLFFSKKIHDVVIGDKKYRSISYDEAEKYNFDVCFGATEGETILNNYPKFKTRILIDNSEAFRMNNLVPLVASGINDELIRSDTNIVSNPNCVSIMILNLLYPLYKQKVISKVILTSLQSVSGMGEKALDKLDRERSDYEYLDKKIVPQFEIGGSSIRMYNNIVPYIGVQETNGKTHEENKIVAELKKVIDPNFEIDVNCIRVPVTVGHTACLHITLKEEVNIQELLRLIELNTNIIYKDILTLEDVQKDEEHVYGTKLRRDPFCPYGFTIILMSNNLSIGAALNSFNLFKTYKERNDVL